MRISIKADQNVNLESCRLTTFGNLLFHSDKKLSLVNSYLDNLYSSLYVPANFSTYQPGEIWAGIFLDAGGIDLRNSSVKDARTGIEINNSTALVKIQNSTFDNNSDYDLLLYKISYDDGNFPLIKGNTFNQTANNIRMASILASECPNVVVDSNTINNSGYFGIISMNNENPLIRKNNITGGNIDGTTSNGIFSYNSNGYYQCNYITQCQNYGMLFDNSQPILFNNLIAVNGIGLYLTNNSNPIMAPASLEDESYVIAGYNCIHHNASMEILCNNSATSSSTPYMFKGQNSIEDTPSLIDTLIYNKVVSESTFIIDCSENYWGGGSPQGRLIPDYSFIYDEYLTSQLSYACESGSESAENSELPQEYLVMGNAMKNQYQGNYTESYNNSQQLLSIENSQINPIIALNNIFTSTYLSNGNFVNLENFYINQILQNPNDSIFINKSKNLAIETKVVRNELEPAIIDYENMINSTLNEEIRFYAMIDKSRAIRLLLDSLLRLYQGDNLPASLDLDELYDEALRSDGNKLQNSKEEKQKRTSKESNIKEQTSANSILAFKNLQNFISDKINNFENLNQTEKRKLIIEKSIVEMAIANYVEGIPSINGKMQYLNQERNQLPLTFKLYQNYPNPFNPTTTINYEIPKEGLVKIKIYNITGREIMTLINEFRNAGYHSIDFNGNNLSSGIYFYKLTTGNFEATKRMVLLK